MHLTAKESATTRQCHDCGIVLPISEFKPWANGRGGVSIRCSACLLKWLEKANARSKAYYQANAEKRRAYQAEYRKKNLPAGKPHTDPVAPAEKACTKCKSTTNAFGRDKRQKDGLTKACKACRNSAATAWRAPQKERLAEKQRHRYHTIVKLKLAGVELPKGD